MLVQHFEPQGRRFTNFHYCYYHNTPHTTPFIIRMLHTFITRMLHTQDHYQNAPHKTPLIIRMLHTQHPSLSEYSTHPLHYHYTYTHNTLIRILHTMPLSEYSTNTICHQNTPHTTPSSSEYSTHNSPCVIMYFYLIYTTPPPCHHVFLSDLHNPSSLSLCISI